MNTLNTLPLTISSLLTIVMGALLYWKTQKIKHKKEPHTYILKLIHESLITYSKRLFSNTCQILAYVSIMIISLSLWLKHTLPIHQLGSFICGGLIIGFISYLAFILTPKLINTTIIKTKTSQTSSVTTVLNASAAISFLYIGAITLGYSICLSSFGLKSAISFGAGLILTSYFLRIGGGLFKASTTISTDITTQSNKNNHRQESRSPSNILDISGDIISNITGFSSDLLGSFIFVLISFSFFHLKFNAHQLPSQQNTALLTLAINIIAAALIIGLLSYIFCIIRIQTKKTENSLLESIYFGLILCLGATVIILNQLKLDLSNILESTTIQLLIPYILGLLFTIIFCFISEFITSQRYSPAQTMTKEIQFGPIILFLNSHSLALKSHSILLLFLIGK